MNCTQLPFEYRELKGSASESFNFMGGKWNASRTFFGPWIDIFSFLNYLMSNITGGGGTSVISSPSYYPEIPGLIPINAKITGKLKTDLNISSGMIKYDFAEIIVDYETLPFSGPAGAFVPPNGVDFTFITEDFTTRTEIIQVPPQYLWLIANPDIDELELEGFRLTIGPDGTAPDAAAWAALGTKEKIPAFNFYNRIIDYTLTEHFVPYPKWDKITDCMSKVNSELFYTPSGNIVPRNRAIYWGPSGSKKHTVTGNDAWQIQHNFSVSDLGWNKTIDPTDPIKLVNGERVLKTKLLGIGEQFAQLYPYRDLNQIFGSY